MSSDDPILDETIVSSFLEAIKKKYDPTLPTDFSDDSPLARLLNSSSPIKVMQGTEENILYVARDSPLDFLPSDFSDDSPVLKILKPIKVEPGKEENVLYVARGSPLDFLPFSFGATLAPPLNMIVIITVTQESA